MVWYGVVCHDIIDMVWYETLEDNWRTKNMKAGFKKYIIILHFPWLKWYLKNIFKS